MKAKFFKDPNSSDFIYHVKKKKFKWLNCIVTWGDNYWVAPTHTQTHP